MTDPDNAFELFADMKSQRYGHCSIKLKNKLYVLGGRQYGGG